MFVQTQSLKIHELRETVQAVENKIAMHTSDHAKEKRELKREIELQRSKAVEKDRKIEEMESQILHEQERSERVVRQAVATLQTIDPNSKYKEGHYEGLFLTSVGKC